jgi:nucleobase:cation symporter-1, NCS1 family
MNIDALYEPAGTSTYAKFDTSGLISLAAGVVAAWAWQYGLVPAMQGPLATSFGNSDFSWLSGSLVAGGVYLLLTLRQAKR